MTLCLLSTVIGETRGQGNESGSGVTHELNARVAGVVAERWHVDARRVVLEWGHVRGGQAMSPDTRFDVRGRTAGTNFTVVFSPDGRRSFAVRLRAGLRVNIPIAARPLPTGHIITDRDVTWGDRVLWNDDVFGEHLDELPIGWRVRSSIAVGQAVRSPAASAPPAVRAGADVEVRWRKRAVTIHLVGVAMHDALIGQHVRVRLDRDRGIIRGTVTATGQVDLSKR